MLELNKIHHGDCLELMKDIPDDYIDLTVTSPPYDNLRTYNGFSFDFENVAKELYRVTKQGGVIVWVVGDSYDKKGSETLTSFKQALYFKDIGFNVHDTMIYQKNSYPFPPSNRYYQQFEYMFVLSKGKPKTTNILKIPTKHQVKDKKTTRKANGELVRMEYETGKPTRKMDNVWKLDVGFNKSTKDKIAFEHPAIFPETLAERHILSWCNLDDIVFDPFMGSGTTAKMAILNNRNFIGCELSKEYVDIANQRIEQRKKVT